MKKYKRDTVKNLYRVTGKYWNTGDTDYLETCMSLSKKIDDKLWCEIESLAGFAVRRKAGVGTLIEALRLFGYEMEEEGDRGR